MQFGCVFIAENWQYCTSTTGDQWVSITMCSKDSFITIKHQLFLANAVPYIISSIWIGLSEVSHPASAHCRLELSTQWINSLGNGFLLVPTDVICDTRFDTYLRIINIISIMYTIHIMHIKRLIVIIHLMHIKRIIVIIHISDLIVNMYTQFNLIGLCLCLESHIPEHVVNQMNSVLVQDWHPLGESSLCRVSETNRAGSQRKTCPE